jgi:hypothetical protein
VLRVERVKKTSVVWLLHRTDSFGRELSLESLFEENTDVRHRGVLADNTYTPSASIWIRGASSSARLARASTCSALRSRSPPSDVT